MPESCINGLLVVAWWFLGARAGGGCDIGRFPI
jgi:hypothetical protein